VRGPLIIGADLVDIPDLVARAEESMDGGQRGDGAG
jgi:hypothetical protein